MVYAFIHIALCLAVVLSLSIHIIGISSRSLPLTMCNLEVLYSNSEHSYYSTLTLVAMVALAMVHLNDRSLN